MKKKKEKAADENSVVAVDRRATGSAGSRDRNEGGESESAPSPAPGGRGLPRDADANGPAVQRAAATTRAGSADNRESSAAGHDDSAPSPVLGDHGLPRKRRTRSEAQRDYWRDVKAGRRVRIEHPHEPPKDPERNPLMDLPERDRAQLFAWLRECPFFDAIQEKVREKGLPAMTHDQINEFFRLQGEEIWEVRLERAADEADALVRYVERTVPKLSDAILTALGQQTFRQVTSGKADTTKLGRLVTLFTKMRGDDRAQRMHGLKRERLERELEGDLHQALEQLAEAVNDKPAASEAFQALQRELAGGKEGGA